RPPTSKETHPVPSLSHLSAQNPGHGEGGREGGRAPVRRVQTEGRSVPGRREGGGRRPTGGGRASRSHGITTPRQKTGDGRPPESVPESSMNFREFPQARGKCVSRYSNGPHSNSGQRESFSVWKQPAS